jgi:monoamine oxidase
VATAAGGAVRRPVGRLHFAGTETALEWNAYVEGALESAESVDGELRDALGG